LLERSFLEWDFGMSVVAGLVRSRSGTCGLESWEWLLLDFLWIEPNERFGTQWKV
jgi:hypothetical protein